MPSFNSLFQPVCMYIPSACAVRLNYNKEHLKTKVSLGNFRHLTCSVFVLSNGRTPGRVIQYTYTVSYEVSADQI